MPDKVEITRKQIIVVDEVGTEKTQYGEYLTWTDKEGKSYKVKSTRKQYFKAIVPGQAVEISFSVLEGTEYPWSVTAVQDKVEVVKPTHLEPSGAMTVVKPEAMTKSDWSEKDRITRKSIERQVALKQAVALAAIKGLDDPQGVITTAKLFEAYLEGNELVEEAKKLLEKGV